MKTAIFDKKNILVIGGAGFVGSHLCDELIKESKVICVDNFLTGDESNISHLLQNQNFKLVNHNIIKPFDLAKSVNSDIFKLEFQGIQEIYFVASPASPYLYNKYPVETLRINSLGLNRALSLAKKYKSKFLYASGAAIYGNDFGKKPVSEKEIGVFDLFSSRGVYAEALRFAENMIYNYSKKYDLDAKIVRIFNAYGPRMSLNDGRMVTEIVKYALMEKNIAVYGKKNDIGTYLYIDDLIQGLVKMMDSDQAGPINLGSEWKITFSDMIKEILSLTQSKSTVEYKKPTSLMNKQPLPNISLAKEKLGWFPIILLSEGLKETIDYLTAQMDILEPERFN